MTQKFLGHPLLVFYPQLARLRLISGGSGKTICAGFTPAAAKARSAQVLRKRNSSGKASSDAGPELAGRESCVAMESPQALMCPLEKGVRGIEISGLCRYPAMNWTARN